MKIVNLLNKEQLMKVIKLLINAIYVRIRIN